MDFCLFLNKEFNGLVNMYSSSFSIDKFILYTCMYFIILIWFYL